MPYSEKQLADNQALMVKGEPIGVTLTIHDDSTAEGTLRLYELSDAERGARGRKWLLTCLGLALPCAVFPPHFPWPFVVASTGIVGYFVRRRQQALVLGGQAHCPKCKAFQLLDPGTAEFPQVHFCTECRERSVVTRASAATGTATSPPNV